MPIIFSMHDVCASAVLLFSKGNHQYDYNASYITPALSILCIATIWPIASIKLVEYLYLHAANWTLKF